MQPRECATATVKVAGYPTLRLSSPTLRLMRLEAAIQSGATLTDTGRRALAQPGSAACPTTTVQDAVESSGNSLRARGAHGRKQRVKCEGHQRPPKMFSKSRFFRQVDAESEIAFSKKDETFQGAQGNLSPLRLPVPPRPLWSLDQRLSAVSGQVELAWP